MPVNTIQDVANIQYGGFYIPVASWFYITVQHQNEIFPYFLAITFIGAIITHSVFRSIFGVEGPSNHPKKKLTTAGYILALMFKKQPGGNPNTVDELLDRISEAITISRFLRFTLLISFSITYVILAIYSLIPLYSLSFPGGDTVAGVLFLTQSLFLFQGLIMDRFASVIPPEEAEWVYVPEYRRIKEEFKQEEDYGESDFRDFPYIFDDIKKSCRDFHYRIKGERILASMEDREDLKGSLEPD